MEERKGSRGAIVSFLQRWGNSMSKNNVDPLCTKLRNADFGWDESSVLSSLLRLANTWGQRGEDFKTLLASRHSWNGPAYVAKNSTEERIIALAGKFQAVLMTEAIQWWNQILSRALMVQFFAGFLQEIKIRKTW